ncbi:MAG: hypothetical protein SOS22_09440 [Absicoccus sp.]|uniref:Uncharacterized protein n=1 Tax=Absicoccus intestinalis TaxID=2926319 RepID=A0ABU4WNL4_9FIRM|nr:MULTISPECIES: hypothetical protein [unclassified Absicoccus]MDX8418159.1 hypothetical protein [Absicoccus sp. CLA-KB-P134]MDY3036425.1 hypothetical protein [Absicoccus sp.]
MITEKYTKKRKFLWIGSILLEIIWLMQYIFFLAHGTYPWFVHFNFIVIAGVLGAIIYYLYIPESLKVVKDKLSYKELEAILKSETFHKLSFSLIKRAYLPSDICISKHWVYMGKVYIPRKMITRLSGQESRHYTIFYVQTINGKEIRIGDVETEEAKRFLKSLKRQIPEIKTTSTELYENFGKVLIDENYKKLSLAQWKEDYAGLHG